MSAEGSPADGPRAAGGARGESTAGTFAHQPHAFLQKRYFLPKFCDICDGILLGAAYKCRTCGLRCHLGYGRNQHVDCRADALWTPCGGHASRALGNYQFGDMTLQTLRNFKSRARTMVLSEAVLEQKDLGNFDKLRDSIARLRAQWSRVRVNRLLLQWQLGTAAGLAVLTYVAVALCARDHGPTAHLLGVMQAASNAAALLTAEGILAAAVYTLARRAKHNALLIHVFLCEVVKVNLSELGIDMLHVATSVKSIASCTLSVTALFLFMACGVWLQCLQAL